MPATYRFEHPDSPLPLTPEETRALRGYFRFLADKYREDEAPIFATPEEAATLLLFARQTVIDMAELRRSEARANAKQQGDCTDAK